MKYFYEDEELTIEEKSVIEYDKFITFLVNVTDFDHTFCQSCGTEIEDDGHTDYCQTC